MTTPITRAELRRRIEADHAELEAVLAQLSAEQMTEPGAQDGWSVKDLLAHIMFWEQRLLRKLAMVLRGEPFQRPVTPLEEGLPEDEHWLDRLNARNFAAHQQRPLADVLADARSSYQAVLARIDALDDADLRDSRRIDALLGAPLLNQILDDTGEHYREHAASLRDWLARRAGAAEAG